MVKLVDIIYDGVILGHIFQSLWDQGFGKGVELIGILRLQYIRKLI